MSGLATPKTPKSQSPAPSTPTGAWRHPRYDEIMSRKYATTFDERHVLLLLTNGSYLVGTYYVPAVFAHLNNLQPWLCVLSSQRLSAAADSLGSKPVNAFVKTYAYPFSICMLILRIALVANLMKALYPLFLRYWQKDDLADIPLTPSQRRSMGLDANVSTPPTVGWRCGTPNYVTPPRYPKASPRSSFSDPSRRRSQSPASGRNSRSNSPFPPSTNSPLLQKAMGGGSTARRLSYDAHASIATGYFGETTSSSMPGTPTPSQGRASVGLNSKWLYEKGRGSPKVVMY